MKARWFTLLTVILCCSACGAPSLRHKQEVSRLLAQGEYVAAEQKLTAAKNKEYKQRDALLYYLDSGVVLHNAGDYAQSDARFALAQDRIDELFTQSVSAHLGRYIINDLTVPYYPAPYEQALTYYYRAMNFLRRGNINGALVEANKAVHYLDNGCGGNTKGCTADPFVQYFASLVFESAGKLDDARIARTRANSLYRKLNGRNGLTRRPQFARSAAGQGEIVFIHENGLMPLKISETFQVGWDQLLLWSHSAREGERLSPEVQNAIMSGVFGESLVLSYPVLQPQSFRIQTSEVITAQGKRYSTLLMSDVAGTAESYLRQNQASVFLRMAARAAAKRVAAVQTKHAVTQASGDESVGDLAGLFVNILGALTEKADTRQWFTLPAQMRMTRFYVPAGVQNVHLRFKDGFGNIVEEYTFENVSVKPGGRVYLHYRTAK